MIELPLRLPWKVLKLVLPARPTKSLILDREGVGVIIFILDDVADELSMSIGLLALEGDMSTTTSFSIKKYKDFDVRFGHKNLENIIITFANVDSTQFGPFWFGFKLFFDLLVLMPSRTHLVHFRPEPLVEKSSNQKFLKKKI